MSIECAMQREKQGILGWLSLIWRRDRQDVHESLMRELRVEFRDPPAPLDDPDIQARVGEFIQRYSGCTENRISRPVVH